MPFFTGNYIMCPVITEEEDHQKMKACIGKVHEFSTEYAHPFSKRIFPTWLKFVKSEDKTVTRAEVRQAKLRNILRNGSANVGELYTPHVTVAHYAGPPLDPTKEADALKIAAIKSTISELYDPSVPYSATLMGLDIQKASIANGSVLKGSIKG
jgi:hypothetical protein